MTFSFCSTSSRLRKGSTLPLPSSRYRTGMPRCCDPARALASLNPNLVAMLSNLLCDLAIHILPRMYRARFFGHQFDLSGLLHYGILPSDTRLTRAA